MIELSPVPRTYVAPRGLESFCELASDFLRLFWSG